MKLTCPYCLLLCLAGIALFAGCTVAPPEPPSGELVQSAKVRDTAPTVPAEDANALVTGNTALAVDLFGALRIDGEHNDKNIFFSPYSISTALAMTYAGARTETEQEMADTLHFTLPQDRLHPAFNALALKLDSRGQNAMGMDGRPMRLNIVNALWGQQGFDFLTEFLDTLAVNYGAGMHLLDFAGDTEGARKIINDWVSYPTEEKIPELLKSGVLDSSIRLVLTNAVYFNAAWKHTFEKKNTQDGKFTRLDGSEVTVPMMHQTEEFAYTEGEGYQAVELPYDGEELSMVILLPGAGTFSNYESALTAEKIASVIGALQQTEVNLTLPRFKTTGAFGLGKTLTDLGMSTAFSSDAADFSGMDGRKDLFIAFVVHQAYVDVSEQGTEAAAATGVGMSLVSVGPEPKTMTVDRPFLFFIRDIETGSILFFGRILDPTDTGE